ncbi:hypothetical protein FOS14_05755 [Skermania sp. ID1734]|uniref:sensor domain-containing protein n=1 Tax=Skermania sp. ID1734 TaxID=2597516 RepID=UPI00117E54E9|nr:sensor domain-containing protein [Skermania sp. ID1734]TSE01231.1 hypothetical protein FOS14_05755 [Skermania sp. ID1734]
MDKLIRCAPVAIALTILVAGCSHGDDSAAQDPALSPLPARVAAPSTATAPPVADSAQLQSALLTVADLPPGFAQLPAGPPGDPTGPRDSNDKSHTDPAECANILAPVAQQFRGASANAVSRFGGPNFASIDIDAASYPASGVGQAFAAVQHTLRDCGHYSGTDADGIAVENWVGGSVQQPRIGDAAVTYRVITSSDGVRLTTDAVVAVVGSTVMQLAAAGQTAIDPALLATLANKQAERLRSGTGS